MWKSWLILTILFCIHHESKAGPGLRGVDFRFQYVTGNLDFTSISGVPRQFKGNGTELQASFYLFEKRNKFRGNLFISSKIMNWVGQDTVAAEYDDLQTFSVAPGLEFQYGAFHIGVSAPHTNANAYYISSTSKGKQFGMDGIALSTGLSWRFGSLGVGLNYSTMNANIDASQLGISTDSTYKESSYGVSLIYYMGILPSKFFIGLFK